MKKYIQTDELQKQIDWTEMMKTDRHTGGRDDQMKGLFFNSKIIGHYNENDHQGMVATCVQLSDNRFAIYNDYHSTYDAWEYATDDNVEKLCIDLSNSAYIFENVNDVKEFLTNKDSQFLENNFDWFESCSDCAGNLLKAMS